MVQPLVTVVTPAFNVGEYIQAAMDSVLAQTFQNWEYIVVDDASGDETAHIAESIAEDDGRIRVVRAEHGGSSAARNIALRQARGTFIAFIDGDDLWDPTFLETTVALLQASPADVVGVFTASQLFSDDVHDLGTIVVENRAYDMRDMLRGWNPTGNGSCMVLRHFALMETGLFDEQLQSAVDLDMLLRLLEPSAERRMIGISDALISYRQRSSSISGNLQARFDALQLIIDRYGSCLRTADKSAFSYPIIMGFENQRAREAVRLFWRSMPFGPMQAVRSKEWRRILVLVFFSTLGKPFAGPARQAKRAVNAMRRGNRANLLSTNVSQHTS